MSRFHGRLPTTFEEAEAALEGRHVRTILNNTRVSRQSETRIEVQYHGNTIAIFHADGRRTFTACGWASQWTNQRLNAMTPRSIGFTIRDGVEHVQVLYSGKPEITHADTVHLAADGSIIDITNSREG